jgi:chloramphenicol-sensitive protein RarD
MVAAYGSWGLLPLYWKAVQSYSATTILCHRIVWSAAFVGAPAGGLHRRDGAFRAALKDRRVLRLLCASSLIDRHQLGALHLGREREPPSSTRALGYYINPLVNVFLGVTFLKNRLRPVQVGRHRPGRPRVGQQVVLGGRVPAVALGLAMSFALYGLIPNITAGRFPHGLLVETLVLFLPALGWLASALPLGLRPRDAGFDHDAPGGAGFVTAVPLIWFAYGARR